MCEHCMDKTTEELMATTGIAERTLEWLDGLAIAAIDIGYRMAAEDSKPDAEPFQGDPLRPFKEPLVQYIAALELLVKKQGTDPGTLLPVLEMPLGPMPSLVS